MLGCLGRMVRESREATKTYTLLINTLHIRILYNTEEKICEFLQPRQKLAGWLADFPACDRNWLAGPQTPISMGHNLTVLIYIR